MEISILDSFLKENFMVQGLISGKMEAYMKDNFQKEKDKVKANGNHKMVTSSKDSTSKI